MGWMADKVMLRFVSGVVVQLRFLFLFLRFFTMFFASERLTCFVFFSGRARTLYECIGGHESELSFLPGQIVTNGMLFSHIWFE